MEERKLNLGCERDYKEGWINHDWRDKDIYGVPTKVDVVWDLNKFPYPFKVNEFDEVLISHTLEHLDEPLKVMKELERITKHDGIITIKVPHFSHRDAYTDITHKHRFSRNSILSLVFYPEVDCQINVKKLVFSNNKFLSWVNPIINYFWNFYERFFYAFFPVQECIWEIQIKKDGVKRTPNKVLLGF